MKRFTFVKEDFEEAAPGASKIDGAATGVTDSEMSETDVDFKEVEQDAEKIKRLEAAHDALEELIEITQDMQEPTERELALVQSNLASVAEIADEPLDELLPEPTMVASVESYSRSGNKALEEAKTGILQKIKAFFIKMWEGIKSLWAKITGGRKNQIEKLKTEAKRAEQKVLRLGNSSAKESYRAALERASIPVDVMLKFQDNLLVKAEATGIGSRYIDMSKCDTGEIISILDDRNSDLMDLMEDSAKMNFKLITGAKDLSSIASRFPGTNPEEEISEFIGTRRRIQNMYLDEMGYGEPKELSDGKVILELESKSKIRVAIHADEGNDKISLFDYSSVQETDISSNALAGVFNSQPKQLAEWINNLEDVVTTISNKIDEINNKTDEVFAGTTKTLKVMLDRVNGISQEESEIIEFSKELRRGLASLTQLNSVTMRVINEAQTVLIKLFFFFIGVVNATF